MNNWIENSPQRTAPSCPMKMPSIFLYFSEPWLNYMATLSEGFGWWYPDALTCTREKKLLMSANYVSWAQPVGFQQSLFITTGVSSCYSVEFHLEKLPKVASSTYWRAWSNIPTSSRVQRLSKMNWFLEISLLIFEALC